MHIDAGVLSAINPQHLVQTYGAIGILIVLFAETGLLIGFFLPGDSLLFVAGFACAGGIPGVRLNLLLVIVLAAIGAIVGAETGYLIGRKVGEPLFERRNQRIFKRKYVDRANAVFERFGAGKAVVIARFIPIVRTFLNPFAGIVPMPLRAFTLWNVVGGVLWTVAVTVLGYFLGQVHFVKAHLELLILLVVLISIMPIVIEIVRERRRESRA